MGKVIRVEFDADKRIADAADDHILRAYHALHDHSYIEADIDDDLLDKVEAYSEEGMVSELQGVYHLNERQARQAFNAGRLSVTEQFNVK